LAVILLNSDAKINFSHLPIVNGSKIELHSLFINLITNAIKFTRGDESPIINITAEENAKHFLFKIEDNGIGIEKKNLAKIYNLFQRLNLKSEYAGNGIGLSHCRKIVQVHGGDIWAESEPGKGTTIFLTLLK